MKNKGYGYAFLSGAVIGVVGGLLFAPKKGSDLRKDIKISADNVYEKVVSFDYSEKKDMLKNKVDSFKDSIQGLDKDKVKDISLESLDALKSKAEDLVNVAKKHAKKNKTEVNNSESIMTISDEDDEDLFDDL
ncbi:MAG: YtxH domain-containing protein [Bacilli bacterium]